jgi:3'-phosphoadenosine 5'-phosphosulfate (PAPS) 3'-phosphatase
LKASFVIPQGWSPQAKAVALAAKRFGMYVADNGADFYVQGEPSSDWDPAARQQLQSITLADMEFVDLKAVTGDARWSADSMAASW